MIYFLTANGAIDDADISAGSTSYGTDSTAAIQAVLDNGGNSLNPIEVIVDGHFSVTGLKYKSYTTITANAGCGFILRPNSNKPILDSYNSSFTAFTTQDITLTGGIYNANGHNAAGFQQLHHNAGGEYNVGLRFFGVKNITFNGITILRARTYAAHFAMWQNVVVNGITIDVGSGVVNTDGLHFNGPGNLARIYNQVSNCYDDQIAFNADDGYNVSEYPYYGGLMYGPITDVIVDGLTLQAGGVFGVRLLSGQSRMDNILIKNVGGVTKGYAVLIDNYWQNPSTNQAAGKGNIGYVRVENISAAVTAFTDYGVHNGVISLSANIERLGLKNIIDGTGGIQTIYRTDGYTYGPTVINPSTLFGNWR